MSELYINYISIKHYTQTTMQGLIANSQIAECYDPTLQKHR